MVLHTQAETRPSDTKKREKREKEKINKYIYIYSKRKQEGKRKENETERGQRGTRPKITRNKRQKKKKAHGGDTTNEQANTQTWPPTSDTW